MSKELILIVDDEINIIELVRVYMEQEGYRLISALDGRSAIQKIRSESPSLVVLDVMLPELDGFEVCKELRSEGNQVPIIMLTARDEDIDKILGLELGADDYMTKPFNPRELVARIKAVLRREVYLSQKDQQVLQAGELILDLTRREATCSSKKIDLRTQEFEVLKVLAEHPGWVFSREKLLNLAWGFDFFGQTRTVDVHVAQIRRKLKGCKVDIETITGIGYKLVI
jgi:two-component system, OmpR family, alkaline phosphatase synthesis response regulator PhoP